MPSWKAFGKKFTDGGVSFSRSKLECYDLGPFEEDDEGQDDQDESDDDADDGSIEEMDSEVVDEVAEEMLRWKNRTSNYGSKDANSRKLRYLAKLRSRVGRGELF